ncbi:MAG: Flp pilus assembly complex ATPase component TadA [Proteobacteria bacterium]|nr:Flp pilus assembly complex ATPase component TadA [Pseudomonadota bacterium]MBU1639614.1 Flp pilus assembly complex ATPase component TadA [Pseudomonadota bacterium]
MTVIFTKKDELGPLLIQHGKISQEQLDRAMAHLDTVPQTLAEILVSLGFVGTQDILTAQAEQLDLMLYHPQETDRYLPIDLSKIFHQGHPFALVQRGDEVILVTHNPEQSEIINSAEISLQMLRSHDETESGSPIADFFTIQLMAEAELRKLCDDHYDLGFNKPETEKFSLDEADVDKLKDMASEAPVIRYVNSLVDTALARRASDIHIESFEEGQLVRFRIDGILYDHETPLRSMQAAIISRVKLLAGLDIAERRIPQDGKISLRLSGKEVDLRVSTLPTIHGEGVVIRILEKTSIVLDLKTLGMPATVEQQFEKLINLPNGLILVTGPTGSGKTTSLYCALDKINTGSNKIITVEDPVEYQLHGINQIQIKPEIGLTFAQGLRAIVRQDPDIIMVGEIRDLETAEIAVQSALTGHLVFSTLHTNDALSAVMRMVDLGVERFLISSALRGVLAQRLVRKICPQCRTPQGMAADQLGTVPGGDFQTFAGVGCKHCAHTGFVGRLGIYELLTMNSDLCRCVTRGEDLKRLEEVARSHGFTEMYIDGIDKVRQGLTTLPEVMRVAREMESVLV